MTPPRKGQAGVGQDGASRDEAVRDLAPDDIAILRKAVAINPRCNRTKYRLARALRVPQPRVDRRDEIMDYPFSIANVELTNRCPMKCVMCPRTDHMTRPLGVMSFDIFRSVVDELAAVNQSNVPGCILYLHHFGESLLHPEFAKFVDYANGLGLFTSVSANPIMFKSAVIADLVASDIGLLQVALDGHDDESFENIRGLRGAYTRSCRQLHAYLQEKIRSKSTTRVTLNMIAFGLNQKSIALKYDYWRDVPGLDAVFIKPFVTWNGSHDEINELEADVEIARRGPVTCREPFLSMNVTWDGSVVPCCYDYDAQYIVGQVGKTSLADIWNGLQMRSLRREFATNEVSNALCRDCRYLRAPPPVESVLHATF